MRLGWALSIAWGVAAFGSSNGCVPLRDLGLYGDGEAGGGSGGAGEPPLGRGGEAGAENPRCGNGMVEDDEDCDDAGQSLSCSTNCETEVCPLGCSCETYEGSFFAHCPETGTWSIARQVCNSYGLALATPRSRSENAYLAHFAARRGRGLTWIGISDADDEGRWIDSDERLVWEGGVNGDPVPDRFSSWGSGQPDDLNDYQHCGTVSSRGEWDDTLCTLNYGFFCVRRPVEPSSCGDGEIEPHEACDDDGASSTCDEDCTAPRCGDGLVNEAAGEECDDANDEELDACSVDCETTGLIAHWPLSERTGGTAWDTARYQHHGVSIADAPFATDGSGLVLNGTSQYVSVPATRAPQAIGATTMLALVRPNDLSSGHHDILQHEGKAETWLRFVDTTLQGGSWTGPELEHATYDVTALFPEPAWTHVGARYDGARWELFVNGVVVASHETTLGGQESDGIWGIGGRTNDARFFAGRIRDVRLYERALSDPEIAAISAHALDLVEP